MLGAQQTQGDVSRPVVYYVIARSALCDEAISTAAIRKLHRAKDHRPRNDIISPSPHSREYVDNIPLHDSGLKSVIHELHITPIDKKVGVTVHLPVFVQ